MVTVYEYDVSLRVSYKQKDGEPFRDSKLVVISEWAYSPSDALMQATYKAANEADAIEQVGFVSVQPPKRYIDAAVARIKKVASEFDDLIDSVKKSAAKAGRRV